MEPERLLVFGPERLGRLLVDSLSEIRHELTLDVRHIKTVAFRSFQHLRVFKQQSFGFHQQLRRIGDAQSGIRSRLLDIQGRTRGNDGTAFRAVGSGPVRSFEQKFPCPACLFRRMPVTAFRILAQPSGNVYRIIMQRHLERKVVIDRVLLDTFHEKSRSAHVRTCFFRFPVLVGSQQTEVAVQIDTRTEVVQVSRHERISPESVRPLIFRPVQVQNQQILLRNGLYNRFPDAPCLHDPHRSRMEILEQPVDGVSYRTQILRSIDRRLAFMERVGGIESVGTVQFLFLFQKITPDDRKQRVGRIQLCGPLESAP